MKYIRNFCFFLTLFFAYSIANCQTASKDYLKPAVRFHADSIFTPINLVMMGYTSTTHVYLTTLNNRYVDTPGNIINASAVPAYVPINKNALTNPYSPLNQMIGAMLPYDSYFQPTQYGQTSYKSENRPYSIAPYGHTPYNVKASIMPYYMLPKF